MRAVLTLATARSAVDAALAYASQNGLRVSVSVVDSHGHDVFAARVDGAPWFSVGVARSKARTAIAFGRDSGSVAGLRDVFPELVVLIDDQLPFRVTALPGGVPLRSEETVVGALGVSGASPEQDVACAQAAVDAIASIHKDQDSQGRE